MVRRYNFCAITAKVLDNNLISLKLQWYPVHYPGFAGARGPRSRRVRAAVVIAAAFVVCWRCVSAGPCRAADDDERACPVFRPRPLAQRRLRMAACWWRRGGLDQDGLLLKLLVSGGLYRYSAGFSAARRSSAPKDPAKCCPAGASSAAMSRCRVDGSTINSRSSSRHAAPSAGRTIHPNRLRGARPACACARRPLGTSPTPTTMVAADASLSSIATSHSARAAYGWRVLRDQFYLGPERRSSAPTAIASCGSAATSRP